ncbi:MAG: GIDE domain-containing protein [Bacteroidota bacterium]|jgi:hypothetical protein
MDISVGYLLALVLTLILSWVTYRYYFRDSVWQDRFSGQMESLSNYIVYSFVILIILFIVLYSNNESMGIVINVLLSGRHRSNNFRVDSFNMWGIFLPFVSVFFGSLLFQYGFLRMPEYLLARNVPRSKIRSAAIGLVEIQGKVISEQVLTTPYSKSQCVYYRSELQEYRQHSTSGSGIEYRWETISTDTNRIPFWVKDETGQIPIYPTGAEFEIPQKQSGFLERDDEDANDQLFTTRVGDKRYNEYLLSTNENVFVLGTLAIRKDPSIPKGIHKGTNNSIFIISDSSKKELNDALKWQMLAGLSYGCTLFIAGFIKILQLSELL